MALATPRCQPTDGLGICNIRVPPGSVIGSPGGISTPSQVSRPFVDGILEILVCWLEDVWAHIAMVICRMMFCKIVGAFYDHFFVRCPKYVVLPLFDAVSHPVEAHVDGSRSTLLGGAVDDAGSG